MTNPNRLDQLQQVTEFYDAARPKTRVEQLVEQAVELDPKAPDYAEKKAAIYKAIANEGLREELRQLGTTPTNDPREQAARAEKKTRLLAKLLDIQEPDTSGYGTHDWQTRSTLERIRALGASSTDGLSPEQRAERQEQHRAILRTFAFPEVSR